MTEEYSKTIESKANEILKPVAGEYTDWIWSLIREDVVDYILNHTDVMNEDNLTYNDISPAIGKALFDRVFVLTPNQYQKAAMKTCSIRETSNTNNDYISIPMLDNAMLGLCGEVGECADLVKKHLYQGHNLDREDLARELGDVSWYLAEAAEAIGYDLELIFRMNIRKLKARYPDGHFNTEQSLHRAENDI